MAILMTGYGVALVRMLESVANDFHLPMIEAVQRPHLGLHHFHLGFLALQILVQFQYGTADDLSLRYQKISQVVIIRFRVEK